MPEETFQVLDHYEETFAIPDHADDPLLDMPPPEGPLDWLVKRFGNVYSQYGEDGLLQAIFERLNHPDSDHYTKPEEMWCFECGAADGVLFSNTRRMVEQGWNSVMVEADPKLAAKLQKEYAENERVRTFNRKVETMGDHTIDNILDEAGAPDVLDLMVIDVDGQDYYLFNSLLRHRTKVAVVEYDPHVKDAMFIPPLGGPGQAGIEAIAWVAAKWGLRAACVTECNVIFVHESLIPMLMS